MLGWFNQLVQDHGIVPATRLLGRVALSRARVKFANKFLPVKTECPCCGWRGSQFHDYIEIGYTVRNAACPQCDSHPRHRYLSLWLSQEFNLEDKTGVALLFAPEKTLEPFWAKASRLQTYKLDIAGARGIDVFAGIKNVPFQSNSIDLVWCHHVLEHIDDDRAAINELCRVLRPRSGELIVSVPMELGTTTDEYGFADPTLSGHWRMYGDDFEDRLKEAGLTVQAINFTPEEDYARYGFNPERFYICKKNP